MTSARRTPTRCGGSDACSSATPPSGACRHAARCNSRAGGTFEARLLVMVRARWNAGRGPQRGTALGHGMVQPGQSPRLCFRPFRGPLPYNRSITSRPGSAHGLSCGGTPYDFGSFSLQLRPVSSLPGDPRPTSRAARPVPHAGRMLTTCRSGDGTGPRLPVPREEDCEDNLSCRSAGARRRRQRRGCGRAPRLRRTGQAPSSAMPRGVWAETAFPAPLWRPALGKSGLTAPREDRGRPRSRHVCSSPASPPPPVAASLRGAACAPTPPIRRATSSAGSPTTPRREAGGGGARRTVQHFLASGLWTARSTATARHPGLLHRRQDLLGRLSRRADETFGYPPATGSSRRSPRSAPAVRRRGPGSIPGPAKTHPHRPPGRHRVGILLRCRRPPEPHGPRGDRPVTASRDRLGARCAR